ncbi:ABC transporter ATP-binding protein [Paenibacillus sp. UMB4589-SE434]|uniref:ABC transporter ATP-binding protein n=1 Tax=Paenibacillus sp. UMB4589-SE434 TaxID=3046314 RepID=UPI00254E2C37|nr:ABC transporter ATP-binding protein [Paenibacillus sp. UMB4589-SE434]MDK8181945.1 ABC transporter ATP-binding protein [Paenibacillus sp. UMB4589-SE434]
MSLLRIEQVVKRFDSRVAVDHLNIQIEKGEIYGLLGPNGAGKSTTIQMITGLLPIDSGDIVLEGKSVKQSPLQTKRKIGIVPQDLAIYEMISARHNVLYFARLYGLRGKLLQERVDEALERVGLLERQHDLASSFSGGMKRRLNIACAITHRPPLIIMDEPTVGIDPHSRNHILDSVKKLNEDGSTIIYTSHYMEEVSAVSTRIGIMNDGRLIATGTEAELRQQFGTDDKLTIETVEALEHNGAAAIDELQKHPHVRQVSLVGNTMELLLKPGEGSLQDILFIMTKHQLSIRSMKREEPNLETLFLTLTGRQLRD